jgi:hypothetical protein
VTVSGQLDRNRCPSGTDSRSGESWFEPRRGNSKAQHHIRGVGLVRISAPAIVV